jgi:hypothetical protein
MKKFLLSLVALAAVGALMFAPRPSAQQIGGAGATAPSWQLVWTSAKIGAATLGASGSGEFSPNIPMGSATRVFVVSSLDSLVGTGAIHISPHGLSSSTADPSVAADRFGLNIDTPISNVDGSTNKTVFSNNSPTGLSTVGHVVHTHGKYQPRQLTVPYMAIQVYKANTVSAGSLTVYVYTK